MWPSATPAAPPRVEGDGQPCRGFPWPTRGPNVRRSACIALRASGDVAAREARMAASVRRPMSSPDVARHRRRYGFPSQVSPSSPVVRFRSARRNPSRGAGFLLSPRSARNTPEDARGRPKQAITCPQLARTGESRPARHPAHSSRPPLASSRCDRTSRRPSPPHRSRPERDQVQRHRTPGQALLPSASA